MRGNLITDWRQQDGRNVLILLKSAPGAYSPYLRRLEVRSFEVSEAHYWMVLGQGFNYNRLL